MMVRKADHCCYILAQAFEGPGNAEFIYLSIYLSKMFIFERQSVRWGEAERERGAENLKWAP